MARFASLDETEIGNLLNVKDSENTQKAAKVASKLFRSYLIEKGLSPDFESLEPGDLDSVLCKFYAEARTIGGRHYKRSTLYSIRHGINRHLSMNSPNPAAMDIIHGKDFRKSQLVFSAATKELKRSGKGGIAHYPPIEKNDLKLMYQYFNLENNVKLQQKVFVDIVMHFGSRSFETLHHLRVSDFSFGHDAGGQLYIYLNKDEFTETQEEDESIAEERMCAMPDDPLCPVISFMKYKRRLNPKCDRFFQRPKRNHENCHSWFDNVPLGHNTIGSMMAGISEKAGLSRRYTNYSLRATLAHSSDSTDSTGDPRCPVSSFKKYSSKLHPDNPNFWQRPKKKFNKFKDTDEAWYDNAAVGKNTLYAFMSNLSEEANLSQRYTNHCIRATSITTLDSQGVEANDIMGISGHKHKRSIKSYNSNLDDQKKREMSDILCKNLPSKSSDVENVNTMSSGLSNQDSCVLSEKKDHFPGKNEYRNILTGDAASAWKRLIGRFYWLNDSEVAKHLIEVHESCCLGTCPLEKTHDEQKSVPESASKQQVPDLIPSTQTCGENRDISLQLEVDDGADSLDDDSSDDSDLDMDSEEEFDIKQEQESMDDTPPTSPNTESTSHKDDRLTPSTSKQSIDSGGDNLSHTLTAVKQEPVETYSIIFAPETSTTDNSRLPLDTIKTESSDSSRISSSCSISRSSVTGNTATQGTGPVKRAIPTALVLNTRQRPDMIGTGALNTVTSSVVQMPPLTQKSSMTQPQTTVTPSVSIVRAPFPLPITLNTGLIGNVLNVPCNTGVHGNVLNAPQTGVVRNVLNAPQTGLVRNVLNSPQTGVVRNVLNAPQTGVVRNVLNAPQNTSMVGNVLQVSQNTGVVGNVLQIPQNCSAVRSVLNAPQSTGVVSNVLPQNTSVVGNVLNAPQNARVVGNVLNAPQNTSVVGNVLQVPQKIPFYTVQRGNTLYLQQASTPLVPTQTFLKVLNSQDTTLDHPVGSSTQSTPQVSQGLPLAANFGMLQSIDQTSIQPVCAPPTPAVTLQRGEQQGQTDKQTDQKNDTTKSQAAEENFTHRESLKRTLSESDKETGTSKRLVT